MSNNYYVYALVDPLSNLPFYIGKGKGQRVFRHLKGQDKVNARKVATIETLRALGYEPFYLMLEEGIEDESEAYRLEYMWIQTFVDYSPHLTNRVGVDLRPPSRKGSTMSEAAKEKIRQYNLGKKRPPRSDQWRLKQSLSKKGKPRCPKSVTK